MSEERHETIDDIVEMLRANARGDRFDDFSFTSLADRIEAAAKREREATRENYSQVGNAEKMRKEVDLYKKTFRKICGCLNKDIEVSKTIHKVDGSSTSFISDCGALPIIFEIAKIIKDTVKEGEE